MIFYVLLIGIFAVAWSNPVRICVPESLSSDCASMSQDVPDSFTCVIAPDIFNCLRKVEKGEADVTNVDPTGIFLGGKFFNLKPIITELVDGLPYRYQAVAVVSKISAIQSARDLRGRSSCHTGLGRTAGWQIPVGKLLSKGVMAPSCEEGELAAVQNFFGGSCAPGNWSSDPVVEQALKMKYRSLCSKCKNPSTCSSDDTYAGYEGVLRCLSDGAADVAFTKIPVLNDYVKSNPDFAEKADILCFDGGRKNVNDPEPCVWGERPTNAYVSRQVAPEEHERLVKVFLDTQIRYSIPQVRRPDWFYKTFFTHSKVSGLKRTEDDRSTYSTYLGDFIDTIRKSRMGCVNDYDAGFCVTSVEELSKCEDFSKVIKTRGMWPSIKCIKSPSKVACMQNAKDGHAQLLVLDGGDVYKGGRYFGLQPVAGELYNGTDATYYAVAVLRSASDVKNLADLRGLRSCHTGMGRTAGWVMPVGILLSEDLLSSDNGCNRATAVAEFFSGGSCVPGANNTKYNPGRVGSELLCRHCIGDENRLNKCSRDSKERFSGYAGALRCLAEGRGDVAFVKHTTVPDYTDGRSQAPWSKDLISSDFKLLCDSGYTADVQGYEHCNLGKVPSHYVVTGGEISQTRKLLLARLLADSSKYFSDKSSFYRLFRPGQQPDLLFKDSATALKITPLDASYDRVLGRRFLEASKAVDPKACF
ncbi:transferrin-like [Uloborus diversus]|uniref:transferrin-like n=1 Tax=Uloborus diversus TaxID=327109 RepID=UPI002409ACD8|nr:transferrin-like [Uloborus diversus]